MSEVLDYVVSCADRGDLQKFLEKHARSKKCIYHGDNGLDLQISYGKVIKVFHDGKELKLVEL
jgi:hypothetical protein